MASSSAGAQPGNVIFGAFMPQGWKMELAGIDGAEAKWAKAVEIAQQAEELGLRLDLGLRPLPQRAPPGPRGGVRVLDHHGRHQPAHQPRSAWARWSGATRYRQPSLLAKITSTVDVISGGRLDWGIGAGWYENEYRGYGYEFPAAKDRIGMLRETVEIVRSMWTKPETTYDGQHYQLRRANCDPKPVQTPAPADLDRRRRRAADAAGGRPATPTAPTSAASRTSSPTSARS